MTSTTRPSSCVNDLSRTFKSREYRPDNKNERKRKITPQKTYGQYFEVRDMPNKGGVGTVCTRDVLCGEVIVSEEHPIVSLLSSGNTNTNMHLCENCLAPIGTLRDQLDALALSSVSSSSCKIKRGIPLLEADNGPIFTSACTTSCESKSCSCGHTWCSTECYDSNKHVHQLLCCGSSVNPKLKHQQRRFRHDATQAGPQFLLAGKVVASVVVAVWHDHKKGIEQWKDTDVFWWKEYSHPLYWDLSDDEDEEITKKALCTSSHLLLLEALQASVSEIVDSSDSCKILHDIIERVITVTNFGEILGMLQCNVMEIEFPSPSQQFVSHLQMILEDEEGKDPKDQMSDKDEWESWIKHYLLRHGDENGILPSIVGSGLFPILTLANHDCDPNASIEFLNESNKGSLVALRNISVGEEITITYIPNGDFDCGDDAGERFRNFKPTRTWFYLNNNAADKNTSSDAECNYCENESDDCSRNSYNDDASDDNDNTSSDDNVDDEQGSPEQTNEVGSLWTERSQALKGYAFSCHCSRCRHEQKHKSTPYCRKLRQIT